ncbi:MAG: serine/threonine protein kinase [Planctomycetota bacterium]|jgi:serine/threonine protein kinase
MSPSDDVKFLALLVHRGYLDRSEAEPMIGALKHGESLDWLLLTGPGWDQERVDQLRKTSAGERPRIPGFEILGQLGAGGTAEVFKARDKKSGKALALKVLNYRSSQNQALLKGFIEEGKLLKTLRHDGLIKGYGVARSGETYLNRLELIEGRTLQEHLDDGQDFPEEVAFRIVLEIAEVLAYLGSNDLVHRDVKPGNVMLDGGGAVKLIDLGFCVNCDVANATGSAVGTVEYLSPEQAEGGAAADLRSDVYSLGVTLFQLTIGRLPFEGDGDEDTLRKAVMESLRSPELKARGTSPHLQYLIEKMMAKEADVRFQSWEELIEDVRGQIEGRAELDYGQSARKNSARVRRPRGPGRKR